MDNRALTKIDLGVPGQLRAVLEGVYAQGEFEGHVLVHDAKSQAEVDIHFNIQNGAIECTDANRTGKVTMMYDFSHLVDPVKDAISAFVKTLLINQLIKDLGNSHDQGANAIWKRICARHCDPGAVECTRGLTLYELNTTLHSIRGVHPTILGHLGGLGKIGFFGRNEPSRRQPSPGLETDVSNALNQVDIDKINSLIKMDEVIAKYKNPSMSIAPPKTA